MMLCGFVLLVNVVHDKPQGLHGIANMSHQPQVPSWSADKAVDASNDQTTLTTCAVTDYSLNLNNVWWKVQLPRRFNIAYLEVYFRSISMSYLFVLLYSLQFVSYVKSLSSISLSHLKY